MSFLDCINGKIKDGLLTPKQVEQITNKYDRLVKKFSKTMGDNQAAIEAAAKIINIESQQLSIRKKNNMEAALAQERIEKLLNENTKKVSDKGAFTKRSDATKYGIAAQDLAERTYTRYKNIQRQFVQNLDQFADKFSSKFAGLKITRDGLPNVIREVMGEATGDANASLMGRAVRDSFDISHSRFKAAGGSIGKLDNYFPQVHKRELVKKSTFAEWHDFILPKLDTKRMVDPDTGLEFTPGKLDEILEASYNDIITNGKASLIQRAEDGGNIISFKGKEMSYRREVSRFIHFKSPDDFLEYNGKYGVGDDGVFDLIFGHLDRMARDVAAMEMLGPKPNAMQRYINGQLNLKGVSEARKGWINGSYDVLLGRTDGGDDEAHWAFNALANTQNIIRSAVLGSASISAISDSTFIAATASLSGMKASRMVGRYMKQLNPLSGADRQIAKRSGYIVEQTSGKAMQDQRFTGDNMGGEFTKKLSEFTNRASGLEAMTVAAKNAVSMEFEATLAELSALKTAWKDLDPALRGMLEKFEVSEGDWKVVLSSKIFEVPEDGSKFLRSQEIALNSEVDAKTAMEIATRIDDVNFFLRDLATNEGSLRTRALTTGAAFGDARKGTFLRAFASSVFMFKSFPVTVLNNHIIPSISMAREGKLGYAAQLAVGTTLLGGMAIQLKEFTKGRTPKDMNDWKFWQAAALQGGGLGLFGDFIFAEYSRFGRDPFMEVLGPMAGLGSDIARTLKGNLERGLDDKEGRFFKDAFNVAKRNLPGSSLWYGRLIAERLFLDHVERMADPKFDKNIRRMERRVKRDSNQEYWWRKGSVTPGR